MSDNTPKPQAPRIAIKFRASASVGYKSSTKVVSEDRHADHSSTLGKRRRPNALHHDSESGEDDDPIAEREVVTTIGADTAASRNSDSSANKRPKKQCIISSQKNRDWKADLKSRKGDNAAPLHSLSRNKPNNSANTPTEQDKDVKWGLTITKKSTQSNTSSQHEELEESEKDTPDTFTMLPQPPIQVDKEALDALLENRYPAQDLIIKDSASSRKPQFSEQDAYRRSMQEAAETSTIEEYNEIPEGEFGAALLRGMGWKGEEFGSKPKQVKRRPHLMGLGSKEDEEIKRGELAKRNGHRDRRPRLDEYRRDQQRQKQERNGRYKDSYKSERDHDRRGQNYDHQHRVHCREPDDGRHR
ncbi:putative pre-mRNA-splicing factor SPP2 [Rosellinia necatrix]|uniref:Pre-mRNA-splicing factor n=1 Tax=Rosellinia necatrix TaxID=77044 RepID=A0A1W2TLN4_ROSNE|nr:putative pre-mRNA-splicing factor SPP2 [Rosellinia necatrix]